MAIVLALFAFGIIFVGNSGSSGGSLSDQTGVSVGNHGFTNKELTKRSIPPSAFSPYLGSPVARNIPNPMFFLEVSQNVRGIALPEVDESERMALIQLTVNAEAEKLGIFVTQDDAEDFILNTLFDDGSGAVDHTKYKEFVEGLDKQMGLKESDFRHLVAGYLTIQKVAEVKNGADIPFSLAKKYGDISRGSQTLDADIVQFDIQDFDGKSSPSDEEIKAFYEAEKTSEAYGKTHFFTPRKIKIAYIPVNLEPISKDETTKLEEEKKQDDTFNAYRKLLRDDDYKGEDTDIVALAEKHGLKVETTELISSDLLVKHFDNYTLTESKALIHDHLLRPGIRKAEKLQVDIVGTHKPSYIHYQILEKEERSPMNFDDSKEIAKDLLIKKTEAEMMKKAAEEAREKLVQAKGEDKDLKEAVKTVGGAHFNKPKFSRSSKELALKNTADLYQKGSRLSPGEITEISSDDSSASFAVIHKREIEKTDQEAIAQSARNTNIPNYIFAEWLIASFENAETTFSQN